MKIRIFISILCLCFLGNGCSSSKSNNSNKDEDSGKLYTSKVNIKNEGGKDLIMTFEEIERHEDISVIRVKHIEGASVPSIMFVVKGCYEIAKIRQKNYFVNIKEWRDKEGNWMYVEAFTSTKDINLKVFERADCVKKIDEDSFMSVKMYDVLWGND